MPDQPGGTDMRRGWRGRKRRKITVRLVFELRDVWVGVFWRVTDVHSSDLSDGWEWRVLSVYICLLPCLPIVVSYSWERPWAMNAVDYDALAAAARDAR